MFSVVFVIVVKIIKCHYEDFEDEQLCLSSFSFVTLFVNYITVKLLN